jgi:hypothetical protein
VKPWKERFFRYLFETAEDYGDEGKEEKMEEKRDIPVFLGIRWNLRKSVKSVDDQGLKIFISADYADGRKFLLRGFWGKGVSGVCHRI